MLDCYFSIGVYLDLPRSDKIKESFLLELQSTQELQSSTQVSHESQGEQKNNQSIEAPIQDSGSVSASSNDGRKVSRQDIELVRKLCHLPLYIYL